MHPRKTMEVSKTIQKFKDIMLCRISFVVDQNWWYVVSVYILEALLWIWVIRYP